MKTKHLTILLVILYTTALVLYITALTSCDLRPDKESEPLTADPILVVGRGAFIGSDGTEVIPSPEFIERAPVFRKIYFPPPSPWDNRPQNRRFQKPN